MIFHSRGETSLCPLLWNRGRDELIGGTSPNSVRRVDARGYRHRDFAERRGNRRDSARSFRRGQRPNIRVVPLAFRSIIPLVLSSDRGGRPIASCGAEFDRFCTPIPAPLPHRSGQRATWLARERRNTNALATHAPLTATQLLCLESCSLGPSRGGSGGDGALLHPRQGGPRRICAGRRQEKFRDNPPDGGR